MDKETIQIRKALIAARLLSTNVIILDNLLGNHVTELPEEEKVRYHEVALNARKAQHLIAEVCAKLEK